MTTKQRLQLADQLYRKLRRELGDKLRGFFVSGSTARGDDGPYSDIEMWSVVRKPVPKSFGRLISGCVAEVEFMTYGEALNAVSEPSLRWPIKVDQFTRVVALRDEDRIIERIRNKLDSLNDDFFTACIRDGIINLTEEVGKVRNAWIRKQEAALRQVAVYVAEITSYIVALENAATIPTARYQWYEHRDWKHVPNGYENALHSAAGVGGASFREVYKAVLALNRMARAITKRRGVSLDGVGSTRQVRPFDGKWPYAEV
jgi:kanamycin nucleotidyltransferase